MQSASDHKSLRIGLVYISLKEYNTSITAEIEEGGRGREGVGAQGSH